MSYDKDNRVYAVAGFVGRDKDWRAVSKNWRNRCLNNRRIAITPPIVKAVSAVFHIFQCLSQFP